MGRVLCFHALEISYLGIVRTFRYIPVIKLRADYTCVMRTFIIKRLLTCPDFAGQLIDIITQLRMIMYLITITLKLLFFVRNSLFAKIKS